MKRLIHEGNVIRIIVKNEKDETFLEIPVTVGIIGTVLASWMAVLGVITAISANCKIVMLKEENKA